MSTKTITTHIPAWVDPESIEWAATDDGTPRGVFERDLHTSGTTYELGGEHDETTSQFFIGGDTGEGRTRIGLAVGLDFVSFGTVEQARAFADALRAAADEAEAILDGAK